MPAPVTRTARSRWTSCSAWRAQRDAAASRARLARRAQAQSRPRPQLPALPLPDAARLWRLIAAATVLAATFAFLAR